MRTRKINFYFSSKTHVVGTQKNRLNETVLLSTQNICLKLWVRKYLQFYAEFFCLSKPMRFSYLEAWVGLIRSINSDFCLTSAGSKHAKIWSRSTQRITADFW